MDGKMRAIAKNQQNGWIGWKLNGQGNGWIEGWEDI